MTDRIRATALAITLALAACAPFPPTRALEPSHLERLTGRREGTLLLASGGGAWWPVVLSVAEDGSLTGEGGRHAGTVVGDDNGRAFSARVSLTVAQERLELTGAWVLAGGSAGLGRAPTFTP